MRTLIQQYAKDLTAGRLASGYEHSYRVYHLAREIGEDMDYDDDVLHAACFLHDVEMATRDPKRSADKAEAILRETGFTPGKIPIVYRAIERHPPGSKPDMTEGKLLHDANLLDSLGAVGMARLSIGSFFWYHYKSMEEVLELMKQMLKYSDSFVCKKSKVLAKIKIEFMDLAVTQFSRELKL